MPFNIFRREVRWGFLFVVLLGEIPARGEDLMDLYLRAREFDPVFLAAVHERQIADETLRESRAGVLPAINTNFDYLKTYRDTKEFTSSPGLEGESHFFNQTFSISLTQPIYRAAEFHRLPQARAEVRQAEFRFTAAEHDLLFRLALAHFTYLAAVDNLDFTVSERTAIWRQLQETEERLQSGLATVTDLHDARARFALAEAAEIDARDTLEDTRQAIAEITGVAPLDLAVLSESLPLVQPDRPDVEAWVEAARFQNPSIKAQQAAVEVANQEIRRQKGGRHPTVNFVARFNQEDSEDITLRSDVERLTTDFGIQIGIPILDGGRFSALARTAALRHQIALQNLELEKRRVEREARAAFQGVRSGIDRVKALEKSVFSHEAALAVKDEGMRSGLNTGLDVLDARRDLFRAKRDLEQALYNYFMSSLKLKLSVGTLSVGDLKEINAYLQ